MSELPGTAAVGIETVEWAAESGGNLTLRVTGRWRRRRPITTGQPTLVIESEGQRHRYPAMPEPPSLAGTAPGVWRLSFIVPGWLAPDLGRTWLQFGTMIIPLPVAVPAPGERAPVSPGTVETGPRAVTSPESDPDEPGPPPAAQPPPPLELSPPAGEAPAMAELASRVAAMERDLNAARAGRDELAASLAERDRSRRVAEQRAHAEQALRRDLARQLSSSAREAERARQAMGELAAAEDRIRALEADLSHARRRSDEAEQVAAAASAARQRAEREREEVRSNLPRGAEAGSAERARLRFEQELRGRRAGTAAWVPVEPVAAALRPAPVPAAPVAEVHPPLPGPPPEPAPPPLPQPPPMPAAASEPSAASEPLVDSLRRELAARGRAEAGLRARLIDLEGRLAARVLLEQRTTAALAQLRTELETLGDALMRERALRAAAERRADELERQLRRQRARSRGAYEAIGELRGALDQLSASAPAPARTAQPAQGPDPAQAAEPPQTLASAPAREPAQAHVAEPPPPPPDAPPASVAPPSPGGLVEPARLNDALTRLRGTIAPQDATLEPGADRPPSLHEALGRRSLEPAFRKLVRTDAAAAGRLLLELLPLQRVVYPHAIAYDLVLGTGRGCVCVTAPDGAATIGVQSAPRPREEVDFQVFGEPARVARLLIAGGFRRRFGRGVARVRGRREGLAALSALLGTPLDLKALHRAGVRLDTSTALALVASMIDPAWTARERFTLAHQEPEGAATTYLSVRGGDPLLVTRNPPEGPVAITIECRGDQLLAVLSGEPVAGLIVRGDAGRLASVREWTKRAQSE